MKRVFFWHRALLALLMMGATAAVAQNTVQNATQKTSQSTMQKTSQSTARKTTQKAQRNTLKNKSQNAAHDTVRNPDDIVWGEIDKLVGRQYYSQAYDGADKLYKSALRSGDMHQSLVGAFYLSKIGAMFREDNADSTLQRFRALLPRLSGVERGVCNMLIADFYCSYLCDNLWRIQRNNAVDDDSLHYSLWDVDRFRSVIKGYVGDAFSDVETLMATPSATLGKLASERTGNGNDLTPTAFDVMAERLLHFVERLASLEGKDAGALAANADILASSPKAFVEAALFKGVDARNNFLAFAIDVMRQRERLHIARGTDDIVVELYMQRLGSLSDIINDELFFEAKGRMLPRAIEEYKGCERVTQLMYILAEDYCSNKQYVKAMALADSALALHPESQGATNCYNLQQRILQKSIDVNLLSLVSSQSPQLARATTKNVDSLFFRIVKRVDIPSASTVVQQRKFLLDKEVLEQWSVPVKRRDDYMEQTTVFPVKAVAQGEYYLLVSSSSDFLKEVMTVEAFGVHDIAFINDDRGDVNMSGFLVNTTDGKPVAGQKVTLSYVNSRNENKGDIASVYSDANGMYDFSTVLKDKKLNTSWLRVWTIYKGVRIENGMGYYYNKSKTVSDVENHKSVIFFDRPVYKPGDTVAFEYLTYIQTDRLSASCTPAKTVAVLLKDVNNKTIDSARLTTDAYGRAGGSFALSADAMPGRWCLLVDEEYRCSAGFTVEAYKQPKFFVGLEPPTGSRRFGDTVTVDGNAMTYSGMPLDGASVVYSVTRREMCPFWRWGWQDWWGYAATSVVANGATSTDGNGAFTIRFVPLPDSGSVLSRRPSYSYIVNAIVTDINGESHEMSQTVSVGYDAGYVAFEDCDSNAMTVSCRNLDGQPVAGLMTLTVERLAVPQQPKMQHVLMKNIDTSAVAMTREEFGVMFPYLDFDGSASDMARWPVAKKVQERKQQLTASDKYRYDLSLLAAGAYRIVASVVAENGDTISSEHLFLREKPLKARPLSSSLITAAADKRQCEVGDTLHITVGSRYRDVTLYVVVSQSRKRLEHRVVRLSDSYATISIPVADTMCGGITVEVAAVKCDMIEKETIAIDVPYTDKMLDVEFATFRDKLTPGENERWTITVKDKKNGNAVDAALLMTMYDHALDSYGSLAWELSPWKRFDAVPSFCAINQTRSSYRSYPQQRNYKEEVPSPFSRCGLVRFVVDFGANKRLYSVSTRGNGIAMSKMDCVVEMEEAGESVAYSATEEAVLSDFVDVDGGQEEAGDEAALRKNHNTLAFFLPSLHTNADGSASVTFVVPDLLTEWSVRGLAWSRDMRVGKLSAKAVTQKRLMATPNAPRFLRQGDTCLLSVKISNMSGCEQSVAVSLEISDAASGDVLAMVVGDAVRHIVLGDGRSGEVSFLVAVPQGAPGAVNYRVMARADGCADGEQDALPILPCRQLVTESMAFYINGVGEKSYVMSHLASLDTTADRTLVNHGLTVDVTANPVWLAIQSLPYVSRQKNPSNIFLANSIYTNKLSLTIVENNPSIKELFDKWGSGDRDALLSELDRNNDLKQTVIEETPWLLDAIGEEQRHREIARFFNTTALERQLDKDVDKLLAAQRADGGWSWIEGGGTSSLYTTQYILKTFGQLQRQGVVLPGRLRRALDKAVDYVDNETYRCYKKYVKGKDVDVVNLHYLYVRSFYPENKLSKNQQEAYDFFYGNAKRKNASYQSLFSQSMLSLVFYRHGDKALAREMSLRIKEKALYSDEMGMYWRDNAGGQRWNERPIETQALLIGVFGEVLSDGESVAKMQQWLLKQKQTTCWNTDVSTVDAVNALLTGAGEGPSPVRMEPSRMSVTFGGQTLATDTSRRQLHVGLRIPGEEVSPADGRLTVAKEDDGIAWGAMYWQYFEDVEKIPASGMGVTLSKQIYRVEADGSLSRLAQLSSLKVGDKVRIHIEIAADRTLEYLELKDPRCAAFEPVSTTSGWSWNGGLSYYRSVTNTANTIYIDRLEKGRYVVEYDLYVNNAGTFVAAPATLQCLYAPEFRALCPSAKITVAK